MTSYENTILWNVEGGSYVLCYPKVEEVVAQMKLLAGNFRCRYVAFPLWYSYKGTSLRRNRLPLGPYGRPMHKALWWSLWPARRERHLAGQNDTRAPAST